MAAPSPWGRALSLGLLSGLTVSLEVIAYFSWWQDEMGTGFTWSHDGWFESQSYSGGSDKLGHYFATHALTRAAAGLMREGGWDEVTSVAVGAAFSLGIYTTYELGDAFQSHTGFSVHDMAANLLGTATGVLMMAVPKLDEWVDTRIEYVPSEEYLDEFSQKGINFNEDYSGLSFLLAVHLSAVKPIEQWDFPLRFVDAVFGFRSDNYRPAPQEPMPTRTQSIFGGVTLNLRRAIDELWLGERHPTFGASAGRTHRLTQFATEFFQLPYTTVPFVTRQISRPGVGKLVER